MTKQLIWFEHLGMGDVAEVGGKNASLGEMISQLRGAGLNVPKGFATTAHAFRSFLAHNRLDPEIQALLSGLNVDDVEALARVGGAIRQKVLDAAFPDALEKALVSAYQTLVGMSPGETAVAVRSSATAEDLPDASFAGQQETFLNVRGAAEVLRAVKQVFASLYNDRAIAYRAHQGFDHRGVALSAGVQKMVRSDRGASGIMFTLDTETGFRDVVFVTSSYGLGEPVVQGAVNPDEFHVHKGNLDAGRPAILRRGLGAKAVKMIYGKSGGPNVVTVDVPAADRQRFSLTDEQVHELARQALLIERHYGRPMDIEWGLDGDEGRFYILQARPETVESRLDGSVMERHRLEERGEVLTQGRAIGQRIGAGTARIIGDIADMARLQPGDVLVADMTDPDWEPVMKRAGAIVTNRGGRTCHAAIVARELGVPAVVGCGDATRSLADGQTVTVSCAEGDDGFVYAGALKFSVTRGDRVDLPELPTKIMMNLGNPGRAFAFSRIPNQGVGLARLEFIISNSIGIHPGALLELERLPEGLRADIARRSAGYPDPLSFYVEKLVEGIATLAASFAGRPVIVRMSDFKSNEYANLLGGERYEPVEENPMLGLRGAARYISEAFRPCFELECRAVKRVREDLGFHNVEVMIPFVRTLDEAAQVIRLLEANGLKRGERGLRVIMMCELPSNAVLAEEFLEHFDGFSIGSNDLTQLTLGVDRDSALVAGSFDERNPAVKSLLSMAIRACRTRKKYVGICGQGPSDYPELARWLMDQGISSISLNPDTVVETWQGLGAG